VAVAKSRPQVQYCLGFIGPVANSNGVRRKTLQVERADVRREARRQRQVPFEVALVDRPLSELS